MSDALHVNHKIFDAKMARFVKLRPELAYMSVRVKRLMLLKQAEEHSARLDDTVKNVLENSEAALKPFGDYVIEYIQEKIVLHGAMFRDGLTGFRTDHIYGLIKARRDIHPLSNFGHLFRKQKSMLQQVGQDIEAMALIRYWDLLLLEGGIIGENELIPEEDDLLQLTRSSEKSLDKLRHLVLA